MNSLLFPSNRGMIHLSTKTKHAGFFSSSACSYPTNAIVRNAPVLLLESTRIVLVDVQAQPQRHGDFAFMASDSEWKKRNRVSQRCATRRAWTLAQAGKIPFEDLKLKMDLQGWRCMYCKDVISLFTARIDHIYALAKGGDHYLYNIALTCNTCNRIKGSRHLKTFCKRIGFNYETIAQEIADINHQLHILVFGQIGDEND